MNDHDDNTADDANVDDDFHAGRLAPGDEGQEQECREEQEGEGEWSAK